MRTFSGIVAIVAGFLWMDYSKTQIGIVSLLSFLGGMVMFGLGISRINFSTGGMKMKVRKNDRPKPKKSWLRRMLEKLRENNSQSETTQNLDPSSIELSKRLGKPWL